MSSLKDELKEAVKIILWSLVAVAIVFLVTWVGLSTYIAIEVLTQ